MRLRFRKPVREKSAETRAPVNPERRSRLREILAWAVHFYTATGLLCAAAMAVLIVRGGPESFRLAFLLMLLATIIDATDGTLARAIEVKRVLPGFDGRRLDDLVDFLNYSCLPLLLLWRAELLPGLHALWLLAPLLASAYGFCQVEAKTADGYFLGFPSYWNIVSFYLYVLPLPVGIIVLVLVAFALLTFVPSRYLYPTQSGRFDRVTNGLGAVWTCLLAWIVWRLPTDEPPNADSIRLAVGSLFFPVYYLVLSWVVSVQYWRIARK
ncbi:MAG TPA: CDP-alcohol phosphatidyltransferase family protein [Gemmataceae bacterium]|jgi:phosphatidylcholine synthase